MKSPRIEQVKEIGRKDILLSLAHVPGSSRIFAGSSGAIVLRADLDSEPHETANLEGHTSYVTGVAVAGMHVVSGSYDRRLIWRDRESGVEVRALRAHDGWIRAVESSPDGRTVASVGDDMVCRLWSGESGRLLAELRGHDVRTPQHFPSMLYACAFSPDGEHLATGDRVGRIVVWSIPARKQVAVLDAPVTYTWDPKQRIHSIGGVRSVAFSPDGAFLAAGGMGKVGNIDHLGGPARVEVFDWKRNERARVFSNDEMKGLVERLVYHPGGEWLLAAGGDNKGFLALLDPASAESLARKRAPMHVHAIALGDDPSMVVGVGHQRIAVWSVAT